MESPKINTIHYVFANRQPQVKGLITSWGLKPAKTEKGLWKQINLVIAKYPEQALMALAHIHPDKDLILSTIKNEAKVNPAIIAPITEKVIKEAIKEDVKSNACGCGGATSGCDGASTCSCGKTSSATGTEAKAKTVAPVVETPITPATANLAIPPAPDKEDKMNYFLGALVVTAIVYMVTKK